MQTDDVRCPVAAVVLVALVPCLPACSPTPVDQADDVATGAVTVAPEAAAGYTAEVVAEGLIGPTQIAPDGAGGFVVAELAGGEREGTGRILHLDALPGERTVLVDGLLTPTGVTVADGWLWVMERRTLSVAPVGDPADRRTVLDDLAFNGRSQGTVSPVPGGGILFDTSGTLDGNRLAEGSGILWYLADPSAAPEPWATGFKHAYAHAPLDDGTWLVTEIADGRLDGEVPPDELVVVAEGQDGGYPHCVGNRTPVAELGGTPGRCAGSVGSAALLEPGSTPTGVVVAPWDPRLALVALWNRGEVVAVRFDPQGAPHEPVVVLGGLARPQHLLVDGDRVLVTDHGSGTVVALAPATGD